MAQTNSAPLARGHHNGFQVAYWSQNQLMYVHTTAAWAPFGYINEFFFCLIDRRAGQILYHIGWL